MVPQSLKAAAHTEHHKDGSLRAKGQKLGGLLHGYWEWFRKDGTLMRSGHFNRGEQTGEWTTYDKRGHAYRVTQMKRKPGTPNVAAGRSD